MTKPSVFRPQVTWWSLVISVFFLASAVADNDLERSGHVLNRLAYGPSPQDLQRIQDTGITPYIFEQLAPETMNESGNQALLTREAALFGEVKPAKESFLISVGVIWLYF